MATRFTTKLIDPGRLAPEARRALTDALYATHQQVFSGVDRDAFGAYVIDSPADWTRVLTLRDASARLRGYAAMHVFLQRHVGRDMAIVRMEISAEPAFRHASFAGRFIASQAVSLSLRYPGRPRYLFACFVHPSAYVSLCRHAPRVWPHPERPTPPHIEALLLSLQRQFKLRPVGEGLVDVGWIARPDGRSHRRLSPEARFYLARNPGYVHGHGLMTLVDLSTPSAVQGSLHFVAHQLQRRWPRRLLEARGVLSAV
ncbi:MAG: hypothetical protein KC620_00800 [Myxococcales bacterium]|nr:hypothetical protein [Myxococcales bacterium]